MAFEKLFSPMKIGPVEIKNRTVMAPMGVCLEPDVNRITDRYVHYFAERAKGGFGLIVSSCAGFDMVTAGVPEPGAFVVRGPEDLDRAKRIVDLVHAYDSKFCFQLLHPGRQGNSDYNENGAQPVAPSALKEADWSQMPRALEVSEIKEIVERYAIAAKTCYDAGADGVDIHCAHGYLIHSFMNPRANKRTDEYGGSFENRVRFMTEVLEAVKAVKPADRFLSVRLNMCDYLEDGLTVDECLEIAKYVETLGVDAISLSGGSYSTKDRLIEPQVWPEECRTELLRKYRDELHLPLITVNHVKRPSVAEKMLEDDLCDFVGLGRASMADPHWAIKAQTGKADQIRYCISCGTCNAHTGLHLPNVCALNPYHTYEFKYNERTFKKTGDGRKVVVIGGGVVGMEAATLAAERGFSVTLFNADAHLGGALDLGRAVPGMEKKGWAVNGFINRMMAAGVHVELNTPVTSVEQITALNPYAVVVATGASPVVPNVPGVKKPIVTQAWHAARNLEDYAGKKVAFIGSGLTGLEIAYGLAAKGADVAIYEQEETICPKASGVSENKNKTALLQELDKCKTSYHVDMELAEITDTGAVFKNTKTGETVDVKADAVVLSLGTTPNTQVEELLKGKVENLIVAGDCAGATRVLEGTSKVFEAVWNL